MMHTKKVTKLFTNKKLPSGALKTTIIHMRDAVRVRDTGAQVCAQPRGVHKHPARGMAQESGGMPEMSAPRITEAAARVAAAKRDAL